MAGARPATAAFVVDTMGARATPAAEAVTHPLDAAAGIAYAVDALADDQEEHGRDEDQIEETPARMYACMHVCMYACMHVRMYACTHVCMYACVHCVHVCMYACMHVGSSRIDTCGVGGSRRQDVWVSRATSAGKSAR